VTDAIGRVQSGTDKTAAELALVRMKEEMDALKKTLSLRAVRAENEKRANNPLITGVLITAVLIACVVLDKLGSIAFFAVIVIAGGFVFRSIALLLNPQSIHLARITRSWNSKSQTSKRVAEKKKLADS